MHPRVFFSFPSSSDKQPRQIELPNENLDAVGCFLEFLYTGDYFPRKVPGQRALEKDPSIPEVDMTGDQLLKHARVYTLADKFGLTRLKNLASSKIHCVNSTAKGEIAYARYIYEHTSPEDTAIRVPVANFWATRSHTLRAEAEEEFRSLCLEFPQFGYDVLSTCPHPGPPFRAPEEEEPPEKKNTPTNHPSFSRSQPASSTRSSGASATKRCSPAPREAPASGPATAARPRRTRKGRMRPGTRRTRALVYYCYYYSSSSSILPPPSPARTIHSITASRHAHTHTSLCILGPGRGGRVAATTNVPWKGKRPVVVVGLYHCFPSLALSPWYLSPFFVSSFWPFYYLARFGVEREEGGEGKGREWMDRWMDSGVEERRLHWPPLL